MVTLFAVNYDGLRKRETYDQLVDLVSSRPSLGEPDRRAKFVRESPQIANLLDGEGMMSFVEMERQAAAAATHKAVEQTVQAEAAQPGAAPAQVLRAAETQTSGPQVASVKSQAGADTRESFAQAAARVVDAGAQAWRPQTHSGGVQTEQTGIPHDRAAPGGPVLPEVFDLAADDRMEVEAENLQANLDELAAAEAQKRQRLAGMIGRNLGEEIGPTQHDFVHRMAAAAQEAAQSGGAEHLPSAAAAAMTPAQLAYAAAQAARSAAPESMHEPKGPPGRPRKTQPLAETPRATKNKAVENPELRAKSKARTGPPPHGGDRSAGQGGAEHPALVGPLAHAADPPEGRQRAEPPEVTPDRQAKPKKRADRRATEPEDEGGSGQAASSSGPAPPPSDPMQHGVGRIEGKSRAWWARQNITLIKTEAELRGHRFSDLDTKGGDVRRGGKKTKAPRMQKGDYLKVLYRLLGI